MPDRSNGKSDATGVSLQSPLILVVVALLLLILIVSPYARYFAQKDLRLYEAAAKKRILATKEKDPAMYLLVQRQSLTRTREGKPRKHLLEFSVKQVPKNSEELAQLISTGLEVFAQVLALQRDENA